jgi:hypothetical protein
MRDPSLTWRARRIFSRMTGIMAFWSPQLCPFLEPIVRAPFFGDTGHQWAGAITPRQRLEYRA